MSEEHIVSYVKNCAENFFNEIYKGLFSDLHFEENNFKICQSDKSVQCITSDGYNLIKIDDVNTKYYIDPNKYIKNNAVDNVLILILKDINKVRNVDFLNHIIYSFLIFYSKVIQFNKKIADEQSAKQMIYEEAANNYLSKIINPTKTLIFRDFLSLSKQKYESNATKGTIITGPHIGNANLYFDEEINISENLRRARKALQLTNEKTYLIYDRENNSFTGLHYTNGNINYAEDYCIEFTGDNSFSLFVYKENNNNHIYKEKLIDVKSGIPYFPHLEEDKFEDEFHKQLQSLQDDNFTLTEGQIEKLTRVVSSIASYQKHGAIIVIEDNAAIEAERFSNIAINIKDPDKVKTTNKNKYKTFGEIDGAIILDFNGFCYSFGVILDGENLIDEGNKERGSRYNSSLRYLRNNQKKSKTLLIVMSEDGGFDILV